VSEPVMDPVFLKRMLEIPLFSFLPFEIVSAANGSAELSLEYKREFDGIFESLHGGFLMTLADTAACIAVLTKTGTDAMVTTTDMNIRFLSACRTKATAKARLIKFGRSLVPVQVDIFDAAGTLVAVAQVTYMRLRG
jgi:uncharacterized protein (TIGR00369 family)